MLAQIKFFEGRKLHFVFLEGRNTKNLVQISMSGFVCVSVFWHSVWWFAKPSRVCVLALSLLTIVTLSYSSPCWSHQPFPHRKCTRSTVPKAIFELLPLSDGNWRAICNPSELTKNVLDRMSICKIANDHFGNRSMVGNKSMATDQ